MKKLEVTVEFEVEGSDDEVEIMKAAMALRLSGRISEAVQGTRQYGRVKVNLRTLTTTVVTEDEDEG